MKKHILFILLSIFSLGTIHAEITWNISDDGVLTISGTNITDYDYNGAPWYSQRNKIKEVVIKNGVTNIGKNAFKHCENLVTINIPSSVTNIGEEAFYGCTSLIAIVIPNNVVNIGERAFSHCGSLTSIKVETGNAHYDSRENCNAIIRKEDNTLIQGSNTTIIPYSVTTIGYSAFCGLNDMTFISIPNSVTDIRGDAFYECAKLASISIPNSVKSIGSYAFAGCKKLKNATIHVNKQLIINGEVFNSTPLENLIMYGETLPSFTNISVAIILCQTTTLYVPSSLYDKYRSTSPWSKFVNIMTIEQRDEVNRVASDAVIAKITAIGKVEYTDACKGKIDDASNAYDVLTDEQKVLVTNLDVLSKAQQTYENLKATAEKLAADKAKADAVIAKITAIGKVEYTDACKGKIDEANKTYNALTADQKALVTNLEVLTNAQQTYDNLKTAAEKLAADKAKADPVITKINAIGKVEYTDACKAKIDDASNAYNALTADQKALVSNLDVLTTAQQTYDNLKTAAEKLAADKAKADPVIAKITAIGKVEYTEACKGKIDAASTAYNALTADQKSLVTNLDVLTTAKQTYDNLKAAAEKLAADKAKAEPVIAKINAIGKVEYTDACKAKIDDASNAYNALTADQKALVTNLDVLTTAKQTYDNLKAAAEKLAADKAKADPVIAKITAIGKVEYTDACKGKIDAATNAYNALTADQKVLVTNHNVLTNAQQTYKTLKAAAEKLAADKAAFDKYKSEIIAIIESLVKEDDSDAVKEIINKAISDINALGYEEAISLDDNKAKINSFVTSVNEAVENQRAEDQKTNGIEELEFAEKVNIYDLNGRKITNSMLKSGLYIRHGKKIVVK